MINYTKNITSSEVFGQLKEKMNFRFGNKLKIFLQKGVKVKKSRR